MRFAGICYRSWRVTHVTCSRPDLRWIERPRFRTDTLLTGFVGVASGSLSVCCVSMWKHCWFTAVKTQRQIRSFRLWQAHSSCLCVCVCFQEGSADSVPLEDEWNERRRIQMTSVGFKGKNKYLCVCVPLRCVWSCFGFFLGWRVSNVTEWQLK